MVRAFAYGAMGRGFDPSLCTNLLFLIPASAVIKVVVCAILFVGWCLKEPLLLIEKSSPCGVGSRFPRSLNEWTFTMCPTPYNRIKMC